MTDPKKKPEPGPKPKFQVVETNLKCQTYDGEKSVSLLVPFDRLMQMMKIDDVEETEAPEFIMNSIMSEDDAKMLRGLSDGAEAIQILMQFSEALGKRFGASLGESQGSSDSSGSTDQPSPTTSGTDSEPQ
ncbi:hypothetical protein [Arthrobacter agilis]|uniref:hypothetical protein n=1 Tax=Arthrobacter agilis TaxID=37921 RepID=UPI0027843A77|nr:hypothetical protein [Arthrobacter agilis]MDQ0735333.1 hypothetical protein [Arthrobacter agilis]